MATRPRSGQTPSRRSVYVAIAIAAIAAGALVAVALLARSGDDESSGPPTPVVELDGIPQNGAILGDPEAAVTLIEYADLQCPACRQYAENILPILVDDYVRPGRVKAEFRGLRFLGPDSDKALRFVIAAGLQDRLWHLQEALYRNQGSENSGWVTDDLARELAAEISGLDVEKLFADKDSSPVTTLIEEDEAQAQADEVPGTPTVLIQIGDEEPYVIDPSALAPALDDALTG
jgi:protein-disulfide isomerase